MSDGPSTPGDAIRARISALGWTQDILASVVGRYRPEITSIIQGRRGVSPDLAVALAAALGETPSWWLSLEADRQLNLLPQADTTKGEVARRARLYEVAPVREMVRRGWISGAKDPDELERELLDFFDVESLATVPTLEVAARKSNLAQHLTKEQRAWGFRVRNIARAMKVKAFDPKRLPALVKRLRRLAAYPEEARDVARLLSDFGIRFVVLEPLASGSIDGASLWLDERSPVVAVSLRIDRIDSFWFTLMHELAHVKHVDALSVDADLVGKGHIPSAMKDEIERRADAQAATWLLDPDELESFIVRVGPMYSKARIVRFAHRIKIHPGIIAGQLQHRGEVKYDAHRTLLVRIRERVLSSAVAEGWGRSLGTI